MDEESPMSHEAPPVAAAVLSSASSQFGTVEHLLQIPGPDLFDGIAGETKDDLRFRGLEEAVTS